jgi:error-prone DNA polymerase
MFIELHARSAFSFLEGASIPEELAGVCAELGMPAMALLDRDGVYGAARFHLAAKKAGLKAHIGAEVTVRTSSLQSRGSPEGICDLRLMNCDLVVQSTNSEPNQKSQITNQQFSAPPRLRGEITALPLLAASRAGYQNLCRLITSMKVRGPKDAPSDGIAATQRDLAEHSQGLICLTGGEEGPLVQALTAGGREQARQQLRELVEIFGRDSVYVELQRHFLREQEARNQALIEMAREFKLPLLAANGVHYARREEQHILDVLTCVREHKTLDTAGRLLARNSERYLKSPQEMEKLFSDLPEAIANAAELSSRLEFTLAGLGYEFPRYPVPEGESMMSFLRKRTEEGAQRYYGHVERELRQRAHRQIERELALVEKLELAGYFLIVWDIVRYCRENNILVQGRGSAANSAVCYSLGITAVDPIRMDLLFERFLSEERGEWPDIDLDLPSGEQRERAIQYVYRRYGERGAAMTANVITYRGRLAAREMGKVLGFDEETTGRLSALVGTWEYKDPNDTLERQFRTAGFNLRHPRMRTFFQLCLAVQDLPRHLGQHSGGMVICQGQLDSVVPLEPAAMPGRVVVQWDKDDCADLGIIKVDLLGLGMMAVLEDSIRMIRQDYGEVVDLAHLPADDPGVYAALQQADTVGMFQIESRAQMSCLPRLKPQRFYDIVVQVAIIRPGPIVGKMVHPYLKRRQGREAVTYPHPALEPVLARTLGVPLFQEQLLRMAMISAGFSGGEAEELRRAFGFKRSERRMRDIEVKLRAGMERNGIADAAQDEIIHAITSFALYGFPESHSASFALLAYASAYLKVHYLAAFTAALLNNQPMGFYHPSTIVKDAQRHGLKMLPADAMHSDWLCTLEFQEPQSRRGEEISDCDSPRSRRGAEENNSNSKSMDFALQGKLHSPPTSGGKMERTPASPNQKSVNRNSEITNRKSSASSRLRGGNDFAVRLGLRYVKGLREEAVRALVRARGEQPFASIEDLAQRVPELRKNELVALAEVGALNSLGEKISPRRRGGAEENNSDLRFAISDLPKTANPTLLNGNSEITNQKPSAPPRLRGEAKFHRRDALWQVERAAQPVGELLKRIDEADETSPLACMTAEERLVSDFRGTGLTVGPHPMAYRREEMNRLGVVCASGLQRLGNGRSTRVAGCVIARQRPGTASGFVFLSLEDETGIANAIITPDLFEQNRFVLVAERFLLIDGVLQKQDGVISVKARKVMPLRVTAANNTSHDFH